MKYLTVDCPAWVQGIGVVLAIDERAYTLTGRAELIVLTQQEARRLVSENKLLGWTPVT